MYLCYKKSILLKNTNAKSLPHSCTERCARQGDREMGCILYSLPLKMDKRCSRDRFQDNNLEQAVFFLFLFFVVVVFGCFLGGGRGGVGGGDLVMHV